jgi:hypothetical protein
MGLHVGIPERRTPLIMARLFYVYGIVPAGAATSGAPLGIDDTTVSAVAEGKVAALASELTGDEYEPDTIAAMSRDMEWVAARATAHDLVLTWASDRGPVIPLPMFSSTFGSVDAVRTMLRDRAGDLRAVLDRVARGREYALRVYRVDAELRTALPALSEEVAALKSAADAASPGQRYLLERKLDERMKEELRVTSQRIAGEIRESLAAEAVESATSPIPRVATDAPGTMILNAAFLVAPDRLRAFQERLTSIVERRQPAGFRFDFTGPWPPYHFSEVSAR